MCSACVNKFAVQELNHLAIQHIESGDVDGAISRLESSVDLDPDVYESRYNLAVAYISKKQCIKALKHLEVAVTLIKDEPAIYHTLGVANNCAYGEVFTAKDKEGKKIDSNYHDPIQAELVSKKAIKYLKDANESFEMYLKLAPNVEDANDVNNVIKSNNQKLEPLLAKYGHLLDGNNNTASK